MRNLIVCLGSVLLLVACSTPESASTPSLPIVTATTYIPSHPTVSLDTIQPGQSPYSFLASSGEEISYLLYKPEQYNPSENWPLIVFLHGWDGDGSKIQRLYEITPTNYVGDLTDFPFIVLSPQLPGGLWPKMFNSINELVDSLTEILAIETDSISLTGYSSGGYGTWKYALAYPDRFAAIAPISSGPSTSASEHVPEGICSLKDLSIWVFHGEEDVETPPVGNIEAVDALESCGANVKFTLFPGIYHVGTWQKAYADPALYDWFLEPGN